MTKSPDITDVVKATRRNVQSKIRLLVCCASWWLVAAIVMIIIGCVLLGFYAKDWGSDENTLEAALSYLGVAFLGLGFLLLLVAILLFCVFRNVLAINHAKTNWISPVFPYGEAPYPQQKISKEAVATISHNDEIVPPYNNDYVPEHNEEYAPAHNDAYAPPPQGIPAPPPPPPLA